MYKVALPISVSNPRFEQYYEGFVKKLKEAKVDRVFLCVSRCVESREQKNRELDVLRKYVPMFKAEGFEVGTWFSSFGHGGTCESAEPRDKDIGITYMVDMDGKVNTESCCPLDKNFQKMFAEWVQELAKTGVEVIMLDDDYRYSIRGGRYFCCCDLHIAALEQELSEPFDADRMEAALTTGGPNPWRDAWMKIQGESLNDFAKMLRAALDEVNDKVRLCHCAVLSTWDVEGVDSYTLARSFAGSTKPLVRLIGAAYWPAVRGFDDIKIATVCEYERLQQSWNEGHEIEVFCEGDVYPRPRYTVPAAYLEGFDQVQRAAGTADGCLKYMLDYCSSPEYEEGYIEKHIDNMPLYEILEKEMAGKTAVGVTVFEPMKTLAIATDPGQSEERFIPASLRFVTDNSLPVRYDAGEDAVFIFGDSAELAEADLFANGAVLDYDAAKILTRRGFDVGVIEFGGDVAVIQEEYDTENDVVNIAGGQWKEMKLAAGAQVQSKILASKDSEDGYYPACYTYENADGQKFLVYAFKARSSFEQRSQHGTFRGWCRAKQLRRLLPWLSGRKLDAVCDPAPDLYIMTKRDGNQLTVGLWNFCEDYVRQPKVRLGEEWSSVISHWGNAVLEGDTVVLDRLNAFECKCFTLVK